MSAKTMVNRDLIEEAFDEADAWGAQIRDDYSGRGMFGDECLGIVFADSRQVFAFFAALAALDEQAGMRLAKCAREDGMGRGAIVYFPGFQLED